MDQFDLEDNQDQEEEPRDRSEDTIMREISAAYEDRRETVLNLTSLYFVIMTLALFVYYVVVFINPASSINLFPPDNVSQDMASSDSSGGNNQDANNISNSADSLLIQLINAYRAENGLSILIYDASLTIAAQTQSDYQASIGQYTHSGAGGTTSTDRATTAGYGGGAKIRAEEMIYAGKSATEESALAWWKSDGPHNAIMLMGDYTHIGIGLATAGDGTKYYTVVVAKVE